MDAILEQGALDPRLASASGRELPRTALLLLGTAMDLVGVAAGALFGVACYRAFHPGESWPGHPDAALTLVLLYWAAYVLIGAANGLYSCRHSLLHVRDTEAVLKLSTLCLLLLYSEAYLLHVPLPRLALGAGWPVTLLIALAARHLNRRLVSTVLVHRRAARPTVIVGTGRDARRLFSFLRNSPQFGVGSVFFINEGEPIEAPFIYSHDYRHRWHAPVHNCRIDAAFLHSIGAAEVFIADPSVTPERLAAIAALATEGGAQLSVMGGLHFQHQAHHGVLRDLDGLPVITYAGLPAPQRLYRIAKRGFDLLLGLALLVCALPSGLAIALGVRLSSPGPIFFAQQRVGLNGQPFRMFKFRTMYTDAPRYSRSPEDPHDSRITPFGRFLRRTSLDELPQLLNVLRGDMSIVGPRPEMPYIVAGYTALERRRLAVPQGLTGLWQLSADRKFSIHQSVEYDLYYVENRGFFLDCAIVLHTLLFAAKGI